MKLLNLKMGCKIMVKLYVRKIRNNEITLNDVPLKWRKLVEEALK